MAINLLLSYAFHADSDVRKVRDKLVCGRLMIDSGAFTVYTKGITVDRVAYAEYLEQWSGCWDHAVTLDVIGDPNETATNTRWLHGRGLPVMPVFTLGMSLADFDAMVKDTRYVCVGGLVRLPRAARVARTRMLQRRAHDNGGGVHALGVGSVTTLRAARPFSADASSVSTTFKFGTVVFFDGEVVRVVSITDKRKLARFQTNIRDHGIDLAQLATTGRMPGKDGRYLLIQAMTMAYASLDEYLKRNWPVEPPDGFDDFGCHLYGSSSYLLDVTAMAEMDAMIHDRTSLAVPRIWSTYGRAHRCRSRPAVA